MVGGNLVNSIRIRPGYDRLAPQARECKTMTDKDEPIRKVVEKLKPHWPVIEKALR
jgi:hypothetical protein